VSEQFDIFFSWALNFLSRSAAIAIGAASGGIIGSIAVVMAIYVYRYRLRERQRVIFEMERGQLPPKEKFDEDEDRSQTPGSMNKEFRFPPSSAGPPTRPQRAAHRLDLSYSARTFSYAEDPQTMYDRADDWNPPPLPSPGRRLTAATASKQAPPGAADALDGLDIERALEMATMYNDGDAESVLANGTLEDASVLRHTRKSSQMPDPFATPVTPSAALMVPWRDRNAVKSGLPLDAVVSNDRSAAAVRPAVAMQSSSLLPSVVERRVSSHPRDGSRF
jgi:hypothetical protein